MVEMGSPTTPRCQKLEHPEAFTVSLASFILLGILVSYLPQHIKIIRRRSSEGLSPWWVLLGGISTVAAIGNILTLPASRVDVKCCEEISGGACAAALLGIAQIGLQFSCFMFIVLLFLIFFPTSPEYDMTSSSASITHSSPPKRRDAVIVGLATLLSLLVVGGVSIALLAALPDYTQAWADLLGTIAGLLATIQYLPQIWYTYRLGDIKSLSIITMMIQVPGAFLFAFSLWQRVGSEGWSVWLVYTITGVLQGILLGMAVLYFLRDRRASKRSHDERSTTSADDANGAAPDERTTLLSNGHKPRPIESSQRSKGSQRQLGLLYSATPPDLDSDRSSSNRGDQG